MAIAWDNLSNIPQACISHVSDTHITAIDRLLNWSLSVDNRPHNVMDCLSIAPAIPLIFPTSCRYFPISSLVAFTVFCCHLKENVTSSPLFEALIPNSLSRSYSPVIASL